MNISGTPGLFNNCTVSLVLAPPKTRVPSPQPEAPPGLSCTKWSCCGSTWSCLLEWQGPQLSAGCSPEYEGVGLRPSEGFPYGKKTTLELLGTGIQEGRLGLPPRTSEAQSDRAEKMTRNA